MSTESLLNEILARLSEIERKVDIANNPLSRISASERGVILGKAIRTGDKKHLKNVINQINGEKSK